MYSLCRLGGWQGLRWIRGHHELGATCSWPWCKPVEFMSLVEAREALNIIVVSDLWLPRNARAKRTFHSWRRTSNNTVYGRLLGRLRSRGCLAASTSLAIRGRNATVQSRFSCLLAAFAQMHSNRTVLTFAAILRRRSSKAE